jgi:hypothetical protein
MTGNNARSLPLGRAVQTDAIDPTPIAPLPEILGKTPYELTSRPELSRLPSDHSISSGTVRL